GPYAERARALVSAHADGLLAAADRFRELAATVASRHDQVITHGEPHSGNLIRGPAGLLLIDWDTVGLALPERDLWWLVRGSVRADGAAARYQALTGRTISEPAIAMYRLRWDLDDVCLFLAEFRGPHDRNQDTEIAFAGLVSGVRALAGARTGRPE
ncbi:MAG: phosphotransferase family protein, partial [Streptosporangiaceae bacterium]